MIVSYMITAECVNCGACEQECPVQAISAAADQYVIDDVLCVECKGYFAEARCKWACPVNACVPERESYLVRAVSLANKGARPVIYKGGPKVAGRVLQPHQLEKVNP